MINVKKINVLGVNILYLTLAILFLTVGYFFQGQEIKSGLLITEYLIIFCPTLFFAMINNLNLKDTFRFKLLSFSKGLTCIICTFLVYPIALFGNLVILNIVRFFTDIKKAPIPEATNVSEYIVLMLIIAFSAGLCEEVLFRGLIMRAYEKFGRKKAIIISAVMFAIFHFNIQNFMGPMILGLLFGYLVEYTGSIWAGVLCHFVNNGFSVTVTYLGNIARRSINDNVSITDGSNVLNDRLLLLKGTIQIGIVALIFGSVLYLIIKRLEKNRRNLIKMDNHLYDEENDMFENTSSIDFKKEIYSLGSMPLVISGIIFIYVMFKQLTY